MLAAALQARFGVQWHMRLAARDPDASSVAHLNAAVSLSVALWQWPALLRAQPQPQQVSPLALLLPHPDKSAQFI